MQNTEGVLLCQIWILRQLVLNFFNKTDRYVLIGSDFFKAKPLRSQHGDNGFSCLGLLAFGDAFEFAFSDTFQFAFASELVYCKNCVLLFAIVFYC